MRAKILFIFQIYLGKESRHPELFGLTRSIGVSSVRGEQSELEIAARVFRVGAYPSNLLRVASL